jgi:hypothetical protein
MEYIQSFINIALIGIIFIQSIRIAKLEKKILS